MLACFLIASASAGAFATTNRSPDLSLTALDREPPEGRAVRSAEALATLAKGVAEKPKDRRARFDLITGLMASGKLVDAEKAAIEWRSVDAYNLVVVRLLGDIYAERGESAKALRTYSAVVELLAKDAGAQRALASVLKQSGDVESAYQRLREANRIRPGDRRLLFELADAAERVGNAEIARETFAKIAKDDEANSSIRYPAKQRLAQILGEQRRKAVSKGADKKAKELSREIQSLAIKGGSVNDIKIYLSWDTDGSDLDLWVTNPAGEKVSYERKTGKFGGTLFHDVTSGYGPESFTAHKAREGNYVVAINYFSAGRSNFPEARGEVVIVLNEGRTNEKKHVLPYRLFAAKQVVTVAKITVN